MSETLACGCASALSARAVSVESEQCVPGSCGAFVLVALRSSDCNRAGREGDCVALACAENQHEGKTLAWFEHATTAVADPERAHDYVAKMDQDAYVWPAELHAHVQGFATERFYGGATGRHPAARFAPAAPPPPPPRRTTTTWRARAASRTNRWRSASTC